MEFAGRSWPPQPGWLAIRQLLLRTSDYQRLLSASLKALPQEACGLLSARFQEESAYLFLWLTPNEDPRPRRFHIGEQTVKEVSAAARARKEVLAGVFHSHAYQPPLPSPTDKRLAKDSAPFWLICAPHRAELRAYIHTGGVFRRTKLSIRRDRMFDWFS